MTATDRFLEAPIEEARQGLREGGIPIGFVIVHRERIILARSQSSRSEAQRHPARRNGCSVRARQYAFSKTG
jgi:tRNA(Arg) A34 adenosine deaminase TadA